MIQPHEAYSERIVFLNRDIFWSDVSFGGGSGLIFSKDTMFFIFTGEIINRIHEFGQRFVYVLTNQSPSAGQWLMNLDWLEITPSSINTSINYDIHQIMEHVNILERRYAEVKDVDWYQRYRKDLLDQYNMAIIINEFYDGYDEQEWSSRESGIHRKLRMLGMSQTEIAEIRGQLLQEATQLFNSQDLEEYEASKEFVEDDPIPEESEIITEASDIQLDGDIY